MKSIVYTVVTGCLLIYLLTGCNASRMMLNHTSVDSSVVVQLDLNGDGVEFINAGNKIINTTLVNLDNKLSAEDKVVAIGTILGAKDRNVSVNSVQITDGRYFPGYGGYGVGSKEELDSKTMEVYLKLKQEPTQQQEKNK